METKVSYTLAGTFMIILTGFIVFAVIWLSGSFTYRKFEYYQVFMSEPISGLAKEGPVEFNGVNVGTVSEIKISHENPRLVILILKVQKDTPVTMGTRAKLGMRALTGNAYLLLEDKGSDMRKPVVMAGQKYPVIPSIPSILLRLDTLLNEFSTSFTQLSKSIQSVLSKQNIKAVQKLLKSGHETLDLIESQTVPAANDALNSFGSMSRDLGKVSSEIRQDPSILIRGKAMPTKLGPGER